MADVKNALFTQPAILVERTRRTLRTSRRWSEGFPAGRMTSHGDRFACVKGVAAEELGWVQAAFDIAR